MLDERAGARLLTCVDGPCRGKEFHTAEPDGETVTVEYEQDSSSPDGLVAYDYAEYKVDGNDLHYIGGLA